MRDNDTQRQATDIGKKNCCDGSTFFLVHVITSSRGAVSAAYLRGFFIVDVLSIGLPFGIIDIISEHASPDDVEVIQRIAYVAGLPKVGSVG